MPEMDGLEAIRLVRQIRPVMPILMMSGGAQLGPMPDYLSMATKLGAIESIRKPFKPEALVTAVAAALGGNDGRQSNVR
jgi:DNA-binding NtrC family response regulator